MARSKDCNGNDLGKAHVNLILKTRLYQLEFTRSMVKKLTANVMPKSTLLHVEGCFYIMGEVVQFERISSGGNS